MNKDKDSDQPIERTLGEAWRQQPVPEPSEAWHQQVMAVIEAESDGPHIVTVAIQTGLAWRAACVTAAAAVIVTALGLWIMPSDAGLAWQLQRDGSGSAWALLMGD